MIWFTWELSYSLYGVAWFAMERNNEVVELVLILPVHRQKKVV